MRDIGRVFQLGNGLYAGEDSLRMQLGPQTVHVLLNVVAIASASKGRPFQSVEGKT